ncbi:FAD-dependent monooxygenase [Streptomyces boncukensis]|uniref:FAD-dependent monooxygenase n=1 Tax=Streptomyces boncukensis TaxID=2711219 RepID=UPI001F49D302|nr:FAD-dependent monooxygenase [Streptomyces boncukensis]
MTTHNFLGLEDWQVWTQHEGTGSCVYPVRGNTELRVTLGFTAQEPLDLDHRDTGGHRALVHERLGHLGGDIPRLLEAMHRAPDFLFDAMAQVRMDRWTSGRVTLLGDAACCPSPLSGQGSSLALVGGYVLADELGAGRGDIASALAAYERRMRPFARLNQDLATENPGAGPSEASMERAKNAVGLDVERHGGAVSEGAHRVRA